MKALITAILSLGLLIIIWCVFYSYSENSINKMTNVCENTVISYIDNEDWSNANDALKDLHKDWHKYKKVALFFLDSTELNSADTTLSKSLKYAKEKDPSNASGELLALRDQLNFLKEKEALSLSNIL